MIERIIHTLRCIVHWFMVGCVMVSKCFDYVPQMIMSASFIDSTSSIASVGLDRNGQKWTGMDRAYVKMQKNFFEYSLVQTNLIGQPPFTQSFL